MKRSINPFYGKRVRLRLIEENDLETTLAWRNSDEARVWFKTTDKITLDAHRRWFNSYQQKDDDFLFVVEAGQQLVGQASVYAIDWQKGGAEVGRFLAAPEAAGRGYMSDACSELIFFCGKELRLGYVFLEVKESNERAIMLYRKKGFREEGRSGGLLRMIRSVREFR